MRSLAVAVLLALLAVAPGARAANPSFYDSGSSQIVPNTVILCATGMTAAPCSSANPLATSASVAAGSTGTDYSANAAAIPIATYVLVATVPATATRAAVEVQNQSAAQIQVVRDVGDGTQATSILLAAGTGANTQGGSWSSVTFKGRIRVYAPSAGAQVSASQD